MIAKDNQAELLKWVRSVFEEPIWLREAPAAAETIDVGHGRIETRKLVVSSALSGSDLWPGIQQVFRSQGQ
jgi:hypothetical protein